MTLTPVEVFITQLARAGAKTADGFLRARAVSKANRDDIIAAATLWCWEHRANYSLTTTLETWFMNAIRDAYKKLQGSELPVSTESIDQFGGTDTTYETASAVSSTAATIKALPATGKKIAKLLMLGYTRDEVLDKGFSKHAFDDTARRLVHLRRLLPDQQRTGNSSTASTPSSDDVGDTLSDIDRELAQLDAPPQHGKECPPCIHCNWWEYRYQPAQSPQVAATASEEIIEAQRSILQRKIEISSKVQQ